MARNRAALAHKHGWPAVNYKYADFTAQDVADALPAYLRKLKRRKHKTGMR